MRPRVTILGIGNVLMGDDGVGPHLVRRLETFRLLPPDVELVDAGTPGNDLSLYMEGRDLLVVLDAVRAEGKPGEVRIFTGEEVRASLPAPLLSPHEPGLREALLKLDFAGGAPRKVVLFGVIPEAVETGAGLTPTVRRALQDIEAELFRLLDRLGVTAPKEGA